MDIFEKQQAVEAIKIVIKARWFVTSNLFLQGIIIKLAFKSGTPIANISVLIFILLGSFGYDFIYWLYLRRRPDKISGFGLQTVKAF